MAGWAIAEHMRNELVEDALDPAGLLRGSLAGAIFHADNGHIPPQRISRNFATS
jgi:transposase InsO family protein